MDAKLSFDLDFWKIDKHFKKEIYEKSLKQFEIVKDDVEWKADPRIIKGTFTGRTLAPAILGSWENNRRT